MVKRSIALVHERVETFIKKEGDFKSLIKKVVLDAQVLIASNKRVMRSLEGPFNSLKKLEGKLSTLKYELVETFE